MLYRYSTPNIWIYRLHFLYLYQIKIGTLLQPINNSGNPSRLRIFMTTTTPLQDNPAISPEKYIEHLQHAARVARKVARLSEDAADNMQKRLESGMSFYQDRSMSNLSEALTESQGIVSQLQHAQKSTVNFDLFD